MNGTVSPEEQFAMVQVANGECGSMSGSLAAHVHRLAAHALTRRNEQLHAHIARLEAALGQLTRANRKLVNRDRQRSAEVRRLSDKLERQKQEIGGVQ